MYFCDNKGNRKRQLSDAGLSLDQQILFINENYRKQTSILYH